MSQAIFIDRLRVMYGNGRPWILVNALGAIAIAGFIFSALSTAYLDRFQGSASFEPDAAAWKIRCAAGQCEGADIEGPCLRWRSRLCPCHAANAS